MQILLKLVTICLLFTFVNCIGVDKSVGETLLLYSLLKKEDSKKCVSNEIKNGKLTVGDCDEKISDRRYHSTDGLKSVEFSKKSKIKTIGKSAFENNELVSITIPNSVTKIGDSAFKNNASLRSVTLPNSITNIAKSTFESTGLTSITIPSSVTTIGESAFASSKLTSLTLPTSVTTIGVSAFNSSELTSVTLPSSVTTIGVSAFTQNQALRKVTLPKSLYDSVKQIGNIDNYFGDQTVVYCDPSNKKLGGNGNC